MALHGNATLKCSARGYPQPKVLWAVDEEQRPLEEALEEGKEFVLEDDGALLHLIDIQHRGSRMFNCAVVNEAGMDEITYAVRTIGKEIQTFFHFL